MENFKTVFTRRFRSKGAQDDEFNPILWSKNFQPSTSDVKVFGESNFGITGTTKNGKFPNERAKQTFQTISMKILHEPKVSYEHKNLS